jgi:hypothetical protein
MTVTRQIQETIVNNGMVARNGGAQLKDNPYQKECYTPTISGCNEEDWKIKVAAWRLGWEYQNDKLNEGN